MYDAALFYGSKADAHSKILIEHGLERGRFVMATVHRQENTDDTDRLRSIFQALQAVAKEMPVVLPLHPRTRKHLEGSGLLWLTEGLTLLPPVGYLDMVMLERSAAVIATDSGGVQKEAYFHGVPCVTVRDETEWEELVELRWNQLAPPKSADITSRIMNAISSKGEDARPYGNGRASEWIVDKLIAGR